MALGGLGGFGWPEVENESKYENNFTLKKMSL